MIYKPAKCSGCILHDSLLGSFNFTLSILLFFLYVVHTVALWNQATALVYSIWYIAVYCRVYAVAPSKKSFVVVNTLNKISTH